MTQHGPGRYHANAETSPGRLALHLWRPLKMGGLQGDNRSISLGPTRTKNTLALVAFLYVLWAVFDWVLFVVVTSALSFISEN